MMVELIANHGLSLGMALIVAAVLVAFLTR